MNYHGARVATVMAFNLKRNWKNPLVVIPVSGLGLIPDSANWNSETYTDSSLPAPLNQLR